MGKTSSARDFEIQRVYVKTTKFDFMYVFRSFDRPSPSPAHVCVCVCLVSLLSRNESKIRSKKKNKRSLEKIILVLRAGLIFTRSDRRLFFCWGWLTHHRTVKFELTTRFSPLFFCFLSVCHV